LTRTAHAVGPAPDVGAGSHIDAGSRLDATPCIDAAPPSSTAAAPPVGLYVHVPFCVSHCPYCDFVVVAGREARGPANRIAAFVEALRNELGLRADALDARFGPVGARPPLATLYLGGGTPSLLRVESLAALIDFVQRRFGLAAGAEVTLEVNPGPDERGDAVAQHAAGVTRISIGAQSMERAELRSLGRRHTPEDVSATVRSARAAGMASVSLDLLYDVPGQTLASWQATLDAALALEPDHLSLYALTLDDPEAEGLTGQMGDHLPLRPGARRWRERARGAQDEDRAAAMYERADRRLAAAGFDWYEISNWARQGHRSRHNQAYWDGRPWEAAGPGAHAFDGVTRRWSAARLDGYLDALCPMDGSKPRLPPGAVDDAPIPTAEVTMLRLRTRPGIPLASLHHVELGGPLAWALGNRLLERHGERLVLSRRGRLLSNEVFSRLL
jgi:oxygen-independent coproporphyrinogen-3 oxidase